MITLTGANVEQAALDWLAGLGWNVRHGADIPERAGRVTEVVR